MAFGSRVVYIGGLPLDCRESELDDVFHKFGRIAAIDLKTPSRPPAYAFIEYEDPRDAEAAVARRDGFDFDGHRLRVELSRRQLGGGGGGRGGGGFGGGGGRGGGGFGGGGFGGGGYGGGGFGGGFGGGPGGPITESMRGMRGATGFKVTVTGLPDSSSWQDLKDHMRRGGEVTRADVMKDKFGTYGVVEYASEGDMARAIRELDGSQFQNPFDSSVIGVRQEGAPMRSPPRRSRSRSPPRRRDSRSPAPRARQSRSRSRSPAPAAEAANGNGGAAAAAANGGTPGIKMLYREGAPSPAGPPAEEEEPKPAPAKEGAGAEGDDQQRVTPNEA